MYDWKDLSTVPTRVLLQWLKEARQYGVYSVGGDKYGPFIEIDALKGELSKREHVPNKLEAEALRRQKAKQGRHHGRADR